MVEPLFDTELLLERKRRALKRAVPGADFLMARVSEELADRLGAVERNFEKAAALFNITGDAATAIASTGKAAVVKRIEADESFLRGAPGLVSKPGTVPLEPDSIDLAVSLLALQENDDIPGMLIQIRRALRPDGLFLG
ncbi:class I SAM-dependent methyltransferase, partial [Pseudomonas sp. SB113]|uniref:methyltransferase domain-containing protein n=1 Tax=Pseudomonas sp. SB113 TaxID=3154123 RepID=UPI00345DF656